MYYVIQIESRFINVLHTYIIRFKMKKKNVFKTCAVLYVRENISQTHMKFVVICLMLLNELSSENIGQRFLTAEECR